MRRRGTKIGELPKEYSEPHEGKVSEYNNHKDNTSLPKWETSNSIHLNKFLFHILDLCYVDACPVYSQHPSTISLIRLGILQQEARLQR